MTTYSADVGAANAEWMTSEDGLAGASRPLIFEADGGTVTFGQETLDRLADEIADDDAGLTVVRQSGALTLRIGSEAFPVRKHPAPRKRRGKTDNYKSAGQIAALAGIPLDSFLAARQRHPDFPAPDVHIGPTEGGEAGKGSVDGWAESRAPEIREWWENCRPGRGAPGRGKSLAHRQAMKAGHARRRAALAAAAEADTAQG